MYLHSQFDLNCTNFTVAQLKTINLARGITGAISLVMVSLILLFLIFYKAYRSALQRLLVYLTMVTCMHDINFVLQIEHQFEYNGQNKFCAFIGFFDTWTSTVLYLFILQINLFLVYTVYKQLRGDPFPRLANSTHLMIVLECFSIFLIVFLPLTYLWLPFTNHTYGVRSGPSSAICWIKGVEKNCKTVHPYSAVVYAETILIGIVCVVHVLFTLGIAVVFCKLAYTYKGIKHRHIKTVRDTLLLMCFLLASAVFDSTSIIFLSLKIGEDITAQYGFWIFSAVGPPFSMLIYPVGFIFYLYDLKKFKWQSIKRAAAGWKTSCGCIRTSKLAHFRSTRMYPVTQNLMATCSSSHLVDVPSSSFFSVPHTGEFTDITVSLTEDQPLVSHSDTGYNSITNEQ